MTNIEVLKLFLTYSNCDSCEDCPFDKKNCVEQFNRNNSGHNGSHHKKDEVEITKDFWIYKD